MCRVLAYLGQPLLLDDLLYEPDNSFIKQTLAPQMLDILNLAGFGMAAWDEGLHTPDEPLVYKAPTLPLFNPNLRMLAGKIRPRALIAHIRGVRSRAQAIINRENVHPFLFQGTRLVMAHNGDLARFSEIRFDLVRHVLPCFAAQVTGTTDSEWIYALLLSQLDNPAEPSVEDVTGALQRTCRLLREILDARGIDLASPLNLLMSDGRYVVASRLVLNFGCYDDELRPEHLVYHSLWYTHGLRYGTHDGEFQTVGGAANTNAVIVSSEPLTRDTSTWVEVPEYSMLTVVPKDDGQHEIRTLSIDDV